MCAFLNVKNTTKKCCSVLLMIGSSVELHKKISYNSVITKKSNKKKTRFWEKLQMLYKTVSKT